MAGPTRFELATSCVTGRRSNQLNYDPNLKSQAGETNGGLLHCQRIGRLGQVTRCSLSHSSPSFLIRLRAPRMS